MRERLCITTNLFDWCLKIFVFLSPIIWWPGFTQEKLQLSFFHYGTIILFGLSTVLPSKRRFRNCNIPILLIFGVALSLLKNPQMLALSFLNVIFGCMLYYAIVQSVDDIRGVLRCFLYVVLVNMGALIFQISGMDLLYVSQVHKGYTWPVYCGFMAMNNHLAMFLGIITPFLVLEGIIGIIALPIVLALLIWFKCYAALGAFTIGLLFIYRRKLKSWKITVPILVLLSVAGFIFVPPLFKEYIYKVTFRWASWDFMIREIFINPFIGGGWDSFKIHSSMLGIEHVLVINSYNEYLRFAYEAGLAFALIYLVNLIRYYKNLFVEVKEQLMSNVLCASVISFFVVFMLQDPLHITRIGVPMLVILALFEASCLKKEEICC